MAECYFIKGLSELMVEVRVIQVYLVKFGSS